MGAADHTCSSQGGERTLVCQENSGVHGLLGKNKTIKTGNYNRLVKLQHGIVEASTKSPNSSEVALALFWRLKEDGLKKVSTSSGFEG